MKGYVACEGDRWYASTDDGCRRKVERHILPVGTIGLRRLRPNHLEALCEELLHRTDGRAAWLPRPVYEVHLVIRGALGDGPARLRLPEWGRCGPWPRLRSIVPNVVLEFGDGPTAFYAALSCRMRV